MMFFNFVFEEFKKVYEVYLIEGIINIDVIFKEC